MIMIIPRCNTQRREILPEESTRITSTTTAQWKYEMSNPLVQLDEPNNDAVRVGACTFSNRWCMLHEGCASGITVDKRILLEKENIEKTCSNNLPRLQEQCRIQYTYVTHSFFLPKDYTQSKRVCTTYVRSFKMLSPLLQQHVCTIITDLRLNWDDGIHALDSYTHKVLLVQ